MWGWEEERGMATTPRWRCQSSTSCGRDSPRFAAMATTAPSDARDLSTEPCKKGGIYVSRLSFE